MGLSGQHLKQGFHFINKKKKVLIILCYHGIIYKNKGVINMNNNNSNNSNNFNLIPIAEYAKMHNINVTTVRCKCIAKNYQTAVKIGRNWLIDKNEPHIDLRYRKNRNEYVSLRREVEKLATEVYTKHQETEKENWNHGKIKKVWFDFQDDAVFCIEYEDGQWYHYLWDGEQLTWY